MDISEIKQKMPEDLHQRLLTAERKVHSLSNWRVGLVAVSTFIGGFVAFLFQIASTVQDLLFHG